MVSNIDRKENGQPMKPKQEQFPQANAHSRLEGALTLTRKFLINLTSLAPTRARRGGRCPVSQAHRPLTMSGQLRLW